MIGTPPEVSPELALLAMSGTAPFPVDRRRHCYRCCYRNREQPLPKSPPSFDPTSGFGAMGRGTSSSTVTVKVAGVVVPSLSAATIFSPEITSAGGVGRILVREVVRQRHRYGRQSPSSHPPPPFPPRSAWRSEPWCCRSCPGSCGAVASLASYCQVTVTPSSSPELIDGAFATCDGSANPIETMLSEPDVNR